jgi:hypothetical protein
MSFLTAAVAAMQSCLDALPNKTELTGASPPTIAK